MFNELERLLKGDEDTLLIRSDKDSEWFTVRLSEQNRDRIIWTLKSDMGAEVSICEPSAELFIGPYIRGDRTGYIVQCIPRSSRKVIEVCLPFTPFVNASMVKKELLALFV